MIRSSIRLAMSCLLVVASQAAEVDKRTALIDHIYPGERRQVFDQMVVMLGQEGFEEKLRAFYREGLDPKVSDASVAVLAAGDTLVLRHLAEVEPVTTDQLREVWARDDVPVTYRKHVGLLLYLRSGDAEVGSAVLTAVPEFFGLFVSIVPPGFDGVVRAWLALRLADGADIPAASQHAPLIAEVMVKRVEDPGLRHLVVVALPQVLHLEERDSFTAVLEVLRRFGDAELVAGFLASTRASGVDLDPEEALAR